MSAAADGACALVGLHVTLLDPQLERQLLLGI